MSHEVESMAYAGEVPWHGLGRKVSNDLTPEQMMRAAGVDWEVHEAPSYAAYNGQNIPTGQKVLIRGDTGAILSNVGQDWHTVQNKDAFGFFTEYVLAGDMDMHTAGSLKGGQIVWALAKIKESFESSTVTRWTLTFCSPALTNTASALTFVSHRFAWSATIRLRSRCLPHRSGLSVSVMQAFLMPSLSKRLSASPTRSLPNTRRWQSFLSPSDTALTFSPSGIFVS